MGACLSDHRPRATVVKKTWRATRGNMKFLKIKWEEYRRKLETLRDRDKMEKGDTKF